MFDFNTITEADEKAAVAKFKEFNRGVTMGKFVSQFGEDNETKWNELLDRSRYSDNAIRVKMLQLAQAINTSCNDTFLGDTSTAFSVNQRGKRVKFTFIELYSLLRAALRERKADAEYIAAKSRVKELTAFINANKSADIKLEEAKEALAKYATAFGEEIKEEEA